MVGSFSIFLSFEQFLSRPDFNYRIILFEVKNNNNDIVNDKKIFVKILRSKNQISDFRIDWRFFDNRREK